MKVENYSYICSINVPLLANMLRLASLYDTLASVACCLSTSEVDPTILLLPYIQLVLAMLPKEFLQRAFLIL